MDKLRKREIGAAITGLARARGLRTRDLATALDVTDSSVGRMLRGKQQILPDRLRILADRFDVSVDRIFWLAQELSPEWTSDTHPDENAPGGDRAQQLSALLVDRVSKLEGEIQELKYMLAAGDSKAAS